MRIVLALIVSVFLAAAGIAQQTPSSQDTAAEKAKQPAAKEKKGKKETPAQAAPEGKTAESKPAEQPKPDAGEATDKDEHYDVSEVPPVVTHHSITVNGKALSYTATTGRLPLKRGDGKIEAEVFFGSPPQRRETGRSLLRPPRFLFETLVNLKCTKFPHQSVDNGHRIR